MGIVFGATVLTGLFGRLLYGRVNRHKRAAARAKHSGTAPGGTKPLQTPDGVKANAKE